MAKNVGSSGARLAYGAIEHPPGTRSSHTFGEILK